LIDKVCLRVITRGIGASSAPHSRQVIGREENFKESVEWPTGNECFQSLVIQTQRTKYIRQRRQYFLCCWHLHPKRRNSQNLLDIHNILCPLFP